MVNDFIANINKSNQSVERQQGATESNIKPSKRQSKKSRVTNFLHVDEFESIPDTSFRRRNKSSSDQHKINNKTVPPTKVKSASWKRSEKPAAPFNNLTNKKHKKSSNWLRFSNSKIKKCDAEQPSERSESLSTCRPGTTYSDVLFGAGCSNLVKIKNDIPPRSYRNQSPNVAPKKLTKCLFKFKGNTDNKAFEESEAEEKKTIFPALQTIKNKLFPSSVKLGINNADKTEVPLSTSATSSQNKIEEGEVPILFDIKESLNENIISYDNCLEDDSKEVDDDDLEANATNFVNNNKYLFDAIATIPKWNFLCVETGTSDGFPKFLCQFEDENYLKAENMALLGLKLALGNCSSTNK